MDLNMFHIEPAIKIQAMIEMSDLLDKALNPVWRSLRMFVSARFRALRQSARNGLRSRIRAEAASSARLSRRRTL